ncbi:S1C family serine protease [Oceanobacillus rekensis]|uniref:S1C family serine protease n=1 Tax=Oceanobacillus rekensis TaxID=937927 RepID=UPI000B4379A5|nr:S1C family serine protease [Oceanobacillus rekensis]
MDNYEQNDRSRSNNDTEHLEDVPEPAGEAVDRDNQQENISSQEQPHEEKRNKKDKRNWKGGLFGGLIGGVIAAIIVAVLFSYNIIPTNDTVENNTDNPQNESAPNVVNTLAAEEADVSTNINEVAQSVVGVVNLKQQSVWTESQEAGTGSGIIYKKEDGKAYVVTNQHVVAGAEEVEIVLSDEERIPATVLGEDSLTDLAVLQVDGEKINTVANLGSSGDLQVGETVLAIGNPLGMNFANTVTKGIVSGLDRSVTVDTNKDGQADWITEVVQTDAAINPGNSGGALVNADGEVIGINSMKIAQGAVEGIGFAIPVDAALPIMEQLEMEGEVTRPLIGISTVSLNQVPPQYRYEINLPDDIEGGMVIADVQQGSPANAAGLQQFDIITKINGQDITSIVELRKYLYSEANIGDNLEVEYIRDSERQTTSLKLQEMEQEAEQQ